MLFLISTSMLIFLAGCSHQAVKSTHFICNQMNWFELGRQDGARGAARISRNAEIKRCSTHASQQLEYEYDNGFEKGLLQYCSMEAGFLSAKLGEDLNLALCPWHVEKKRADGYGIGLKVKSIEQELILIEKNIQIQTVSRTPAANLGLDNLIISKRNKELEIQRLTSQLDTLN